MTTHELPSHHKKLVDGGWLQDGKIIQLWLDTEYWISYYVVLYTHKDQGNGYHGVSIRCFRVYGNDDHMGTVRVSCDQDVDAGFQKNSDIPVVSMRQSRNWAPVED